LPNTVPEIRVILNPAAAKGKALNMLPKIRKLMDFHNLDYEVVVTRYIGHAIESAEEAARQGISIVTAAGGDGTCNEVVNGLMRGSVTGSGRVPVKTAFSVLPIGRGNDFAFSAGIPKKLEDAVSLIKTGARRHIDTARVYGGTFPEGRYFLNGLGIGFEPLVNLTASRYKRISGAISYLFAVIEIMKNYPKAVPVKLFYRGKNCDILTQQISVCNGRRMGGAFLMGPDAVIDDGHLDLCYVNRPVSGGRILYLVTRFFRGTQKSHPYIASDLTGDITVKTSDGSTRLICHIDGEMVSTGTDVLRIELYPQSLPIVSQQSNGSIYG